MLQPPTHRPLLTVMLLAWTLMLCATPTLARERQGFAPVTKPQPILKLDDIRIGMKGYGLSVFHGTKIEAFPVEVVSVMHDFGPRQGAIWVRCPDERMQHTGPVSGMSGSPIYLWADGEEQELGKGGKLIGAFAYGYAFTRDCYVGVQPIEHMRMVADYAKELPASQRSNQPQSFGRRQPDLAASMQQVLALAQQHGIEERWQIEALLNALQPPQRTGDGDDANPANDADRADRHDADRPSQRTAPNFPQPARFEGRATPMLMPVMVRGRGVADMLQPVLEPMGLMPVASPTGMVSGKPPREIDPEKIVFEPGSVLAVPYAWGDLDFSATGTVTDVLPDGRVLAFGHPMMASGESAFPMATGFVHFVEPNLRISFKLGGSAVIRGALVRDEFSAVVGRPDAKAFAAPMDVTVNIEGRPERTYDFHVVRHREFMGIITAIMGIQSLLAEHELPEENTMRMRATLSFEGHEPLVIDRVSVMASPFEIFMAVMPVINAMLNNPWEEVALTKVSMRFDVEPRIRLGVIQSGRLLTPRVAPGDTVEATLLIQPHGQQPAPHRIRFTLPDDLPDGVYPLTVGAGSAYMGVVASAQPHLSHVENASDLMALARLINSIRSDRIYAVMPVPRQGLAVGRTEMPELPASRAIIVAGSPGVAARVFTATHESSEQVDYVVRGSHTFRITVDRNLPRRNAR